MMLFCPRSDKEVVLAKMDSSQVKRELVKHCYELIIGSARSVSYSQTYRIRRNKFLERLQIFPADYEKFCYLRD